MITKVRLLKTLKAGDKVWVAGTILPSGMSPAIPDEILKEVRNRAGTVEVLEVKNPRPVPIEKVDEDFRGTTASFFKTSNLITPLKDEEKAFKEELKGAPHEEEEKAPEKPKKKSAKKKTSAKKPRSSKKKIGLKLSSRVKK